MTFVSSSSVGRSLVAMSFIFVIKGVLGDRLKSQVNSLPGRRISPRERETYSLINRGDLAS